MRFGAHYLPTYVPRLEGTVNQFYQVMFEQMEEFERLGYHDIWVTEHHFSGYGGSLPHPPTFLAAIARTTKSIRLGVAISVLPLHQPLDVAEAYAMVDVISGGRLEFGVGKGSEPIEYRKFGLTMDNAAVQMKEGTAIIQQAWSDNPVNFDGEMFTYHDVNVLPKPVQRPHPPIWVGAAKSEDTFQWAGENGFHLMTLPYMYPTPDFLHKNVGVYQKALKQGGHQKGEILGKFHVYVTDSLDKAVHDTEPHLKNYHEAHKAADPNRESRLRSRDDFVSEIEKGFIIAGDPQRCIDAIHRWREEVGLTTMSGTFHFGGMPNELALKNIRLFAERVMPVFA
ncbi:MAG: LLM class flavin-dependent oxidoreductase [Deltaproteobacteria bacterium]|nr:LLM class flavin-dependent oxidoreductase [Deltaproteobacteria bacterium]